MKYKLWLLLILIIASWLRFYHLDNRGLFTDEKFTMLNANGIWVNAGNQPEIQNNEYFTPKDFWAKKNIKDYFESIANSDFGTHIVYNGILHFWMKVFGNSDFSVRLPGLIFNLLTIFLIFQLSIKVFGSWFAALISGILFAVDPLNVAMSHIARSYTLSFLLMLWATWIFIKLLEKNKLGQKTLGLFILYAILVGLGLLNHYLNFLVPLSHAIAFLLIPKKNKLWPGFILSGLFNVLLMFYWFNWGGGYTAFDFLKDKNQKHLQIAKMENNPLENIIQLSTPDIVLKKTISLFFDTTPLSTQVFKEINGVKNTIYAFIIYLLLLIFTKYKGEKFNKFLLIIPIIGLLFLLKGVIPYALVVIFIFAIAGYLIELLVTNKTFNREQKSLLIIGFCMLVIPILFVVQDALRNGHTTSLVNRYIGISVPFVILTFGFIIKEIISKSTIIGVVFCLVLLIQFKNVKEEISDFFNDKSSLNAFFEPERIPNPYISLAKKVKTQYVSGDTLVIPGGFKTVYEENFHKGDYISYLDAQYINLYLSPKDKILQTIDRNEIDKVFLKKSNGQKVLLFDFEGKKYRY